MGNDRAKYAGALPLLHSDPDLGVKADTQTDTVDLDNLFGLVMLCLEDPNGDWKWNGYSVEDAVRMLEKEVRAQRDRADKAEAKLAEYDALKPYVEKLRVDLLDETPVWDDLDKALDRVLLAFPCDPYNVKYGTSQALDGGDDG